ncbi:MAG: FeoB-associated Cys-rich membrane protein [Oscillospiraceae bacterium]|nr:FeoB-associated Cys-rich membrane protein [Oscillospiraceae bacterium]
MPTFSPADWVILALLAVCIVLAIRSVLRQRKKGGCPGCSGCGSCTRKDCCSRKSKS